jgi:hypothetical protein
MATSFLVDAAAPHGPDERGSRPHGSARSKQTSAGLRVALTRNEAIKFAVLALAAQRHLANNIPAASGASRFAILGKLVAAPRMAQGAG